MTRQKRNKWLVAFVKVVGAWLGSLLFLTLLMVVMSWSLIFKYAGPPADPAISLGVLKSILWIPFVVWMYFTWFMAYAWAWMAGVSGLTLLIMRPLPWRRWLRLPPTNPDPNSTSPPD